jgi:hypothetical protein
VKFDVPGLDGFPVIVPPPLSVKPCGSVPAVTDQVLPPLPPDAASVCEYAVPTVALGSDEVVTASAALTTSVSAWSSVLAAESRTLTVKLEVPAASGMPTNVLVSGTSRMPVGRLPETMLQVYGAVPPVTARVCEYVVPTEPAGSEVVVILG